MCAVHDIYGFRQKTFGSWAEYMLFPAGARNYQVPKSIPLHHAVFIEPLACSIHAVERGDIQYQDTVVIAGCGPLGLGMVAAARMKGPACIIARIKGLASEAPSLNPTRVVSRSSSWR